MMSDNLVIREFRAEDAKAVVRLHNDSADSFEDASVTEEFVKEIADRVDFRFFILSDSMRNAVGFVGVLYQVNVKRAEIGPICIRSDHRRKGAGTRALDHAISFLRQAGVRRTIAKVKVKNIGSVAFFKARGFSEEGCFRNYTAVGEDVVQLVRFI
jgi:ribosomal protein S18 acetylase RimI-like enzyme